MRIPLVVLLGLLGCASPLAPRPDEPPDSVGSDRPIRAVPRPVAADPSRIELGKRLFHEPLLSRDGRTSCATCHDTSAAGTDNDTHLSPMGRVNTPTVFNAALNYRHFWNARARNLADQIDGPLLGSAEMNSDWGLVLSRLAVDAGYRRAFNATYPDGLTVENIRVAIVAYEETLLTLDAPFDRHLGGDADAIDATQLRGYELFVSYGCSSCHQGANVGGNLTQKLGIFASPFPNDGTSTPIDEGMLAVTGDEADRHRFRVPSLRLAVRTAPYFHDGAIATLDEAVRLMGEYQLGVEIPSEDRALIMAFLEALPGSYQGRRL